MVTPASGIMKHFLGVFKRHKNAYLISSPQETRLQQNYKLSTHLVFRIWSIFSNQLGVKWHLENWKNLYNLWRLVWRRETQYVSYSLADAPFPREGTCGEGNKVVALEATRIMNHGKIKLSIMHHRKSIGDPPKRIALYKIPRCAHSEIKS